MNKLNIHIVKDDTLGDEDGGLALGAWVSDWDDHNVILLNVEAHFGDWEDLRGNDYYASREDRIREMIQTCMHEFGHCLEEYFDLNFDEEFVEKVCQSYKFKDK